MTLKGKSGSRTGVSRRDLLKTNSKRSKVKIRDRTRAKAKPYDRVQYDGHQDQEQGPQ